MTDRFAFVYHMERVEIALGHGFNGVEVAAGLSPGRPVAGRVRVFAVVETCRADKPVCRPFYSSLFSHTRVGGEGLMMGAGQHRWWVGDGCVGKAKDTFPSILI